ncbi:MAG: hypothetical protein A1D16_09370 [Flavihumibacter sp. CACIAM 22H1]|nr:MAG: hypothetical protein A1D16_09370 [Flavihumibacter sp. CACIAM 22H1]
MFSIIYVHSYAQNVGINTNSPQGTLDVNGTPANTGASDGIIPPRITRAQLIAKTGYGANHAGSVVYITDLSGTVNNITRHVQHIGLYVFDGTKWNPLQNKMLGFSAVRTTSFTIPAITFTTLVYPEKDYDTNNWYNTSTGVFQPTQPGYYNVNASATIYDTKEYLRIISIYKNGALFTSGSAHYSNGVCISVSSLVYFNGTTDYINITLYCNQALSVTPARRETFFQAYFVGN